MTTSGSSADHPAAALRTFSDAIGLTVAPDESPDEITLSIPEFRNHNFGLLQGTEATRLAALHAAFEGLINTYGPSLTFKLKFGADELKSEGYTYDNLKAFCEAVEASPISLYLKIDKTALATSWNLTDPSANLKLFFSSEALVHALNQPLTQLEQENGLMRDFTGEKKVIILVLDHEIDLNGDHLAVLGGTAAGNWRNYLPSDNRREAAAKINFVHADATAKPKWSNIRLEHLTPLQLLVSWEKPDRQVGSPPNDDRIARALYSHLLACSMLYLATYSKLNEPAAGGAAPAGQRSLLFTFAEDKYLARIELGSTERIGETLVRGNQPEPWEAPLTLGRLVEWVYKEERGIPVRLALTQAVIANSLQDSKPSDALLELLKRAPETKERILSRWDAFMDERLKEYFANVKALEETVETTSKSYGDQVQSLTKTLTENMLAAVAVVVGSFLAAIFKTPFEHKIFIFGTTAYMFYLAIFPVLIGLISAWQQYEKSKESFEKRKRDFGTRLTDAEVDTIVGNAVTSRERWFENWFNFTEVVYVVAIGLMAIAISIVPGVVKRWADDFTLTGISYDKPVDGRTVPVVIRGDHFDKDKRILVSLAGAQFSNTGAPPVTVHGLTVLTLAPTRQDLQAAINQNKREVRVRQGNAKEIIAELPKDPLPASPNPEFRHWEWVGKEDDGVATGTGSKLDSIVKVTINGVQSRFKTSEDGKQIELYGFSKAALRNTNATLVLTDGREITEPIAFSR